MSGWGKLQEDTKRDLRTWFNSEPDYADMTCLSRLYLTGRFKAWDCPECGERVYWGSPINWDNFQGVCQADYTSYPGDLEKYTPEYNEQMCDSVDYNTPEVRTLVAELTSIGYNVRLCQRLNRPFGGWAK